MSLESNLRRLERAAADAGTCRTCGGKGWGRIKMRETPEAEPFIIGGCPACGRGEVYSVIEGVDGREFERPPERKDSPA